VIDGQKLRVRAATLFNLVRISDVISVFDYDPRGNPLVS
jgi:hypothetical protein